MPRVGSSRMSTSGPENSHLLNTTFCWLPPDKFTVFWKTPEQGAATSVLVATSPLLNGVGGRYFEDSQEAGPHVPGTMSGAAEYALDPEQAERLWAVSEDLLA